MWSLKIQEISIIGELLSSKNRWMNIMNSLPFIGMRRRLSESRLINLRMNLIIISKDWTLYARVRDFRDHKGGHRSDKVLEPKEGHMCLLTEEVDLVVAKQETLQLVLLRRDPLLERGLVSIPIHLQIGGQEPYLNLLLVL